MNTLTPALASALSALESGRPLPKEPQAYRLQTPEQMRRLVQMNVRIRLRRKAESQA